jgi:hypothetical protein
MDEDYELHTWLPLNHVIVLGVSFSIVLLLIIIALPARSIAHICQIVQFRF